METITGEVLQILTYARHSWPLSSEGSLSCHIYCDTGLSFIMVIPEDPWHSHLLSSVLRFGAVITCFYVCRDWDSNTQPSACGANALTHCASAAGRRFLNFANVFSLFRNDHPFEKGFALYFKVQL